MNKYLVLVGILVALIFVSTTYVVLKLSDGAKPEIVGVEQNVTIRFSVDTHTFDPQSFAVTKGDMVYIKLINEDSGAHGFANDLFAVSAHVPAKSTVLLPPFLASEAGSFIFYCPTSDERHFGETGTLIVRPTSGPK